MKDQMFVMAKFNSYKIGYSEGAKSLMEKPEYHIVCSTTENELEFNTTLINPWYYKNTTGQTKKAEERESIGILGNLKVLKDFGFYLSDSVMNKKEAKNLCLEMESELLTIKSLEAKFEIFAKMEN